MPEPLRVKRGEELCALVRREILNHHLVVRRQGPRAPKQYIHRQFEAFFCRGWGLRVRHLRDECKRRADRSTSLSRRLNQPSASG